MPVPRKTSLKLPDIRFSRGVPFFGTARERRETLSLIRRLAMSARAAVPDLPLGAITLKPLSGGRSAAGVFRLTPFAGPGRGVECPPLVVKIASPAQGSGERANYEKFARALPAGCRPDLLAFERTRSRSGLCYSFVGDSGRSRPDTLTACLRRGDTEKLGVLLRGFFDPLRGTWYNPALLRAESDMARRYLERYFTGRCSMVRTEASLRACAARYFKARQEGERILIGGLSFPSLRAALFAPRRKRPYRSCILHGDLNSDNIVFTGGSPGVAVVDFQKIGRGHVYEDFMHVEASVRINYPRDASFGDILDKERLIALGRRSRKDPYAAAIRKIRSAAFRHFGGIEDEAGYHFAAAAIGLRLMQATDLSHCARARITASALWAAKALESGI